jgi:hypothetical protein
MSWLVLPLAVLAAFGGLLTAFTALVLALVFEARRCNRARNVMAGITVLASLVAAASVWAFLNVTRVEFWLDRPHLVVVSRRGTAVADAIDAFEMDHSYPPSSLDELVPRYLSQVPETGWAAHPTFEYSTANGEWSLWVDTEKLFAFDTFSYAPEKQDYEEPGYTDRIGDWLYVHE